MYLLLSFRSVYLEIEIVCKHHQRTDLMSIKGARYRPNADVITSKNRWSLIWPSSLFCAACACLSARPIGVSSEPLLLLPTRLAGVLSVTSGGTSHRCDELEDLLTKPSLMLSYEGSSSIDADWPISGLTALRNDG